MRLKKSEQGFSLIEGLLVILVVVAIVGVGFYIFSKSKDDSSSKDTSKKSSNSSSTSKTGTDTTTPKVATAGDYLDLIDTKLVDLSKNQSVVSGAEFTVEKVELDFGGVKLKTSTGYNEVAPKTGDKADYRLDRAVTDSESSESYNAYLSNFDAAVDSLVVYSVDKLGFTKVDTHEEEGITDIFAYTLLSKGDLYCQIIKGGWTIGLACVTQ